MTSVRVNLPTIPRNTCPGSMIELGSSSDADDRVDRLRLSLSVASPPVTARSDPDMDSDSLLAECAGKSADPGRCRERNRLPAAGIFCLNNVQINMEEFCSRRRALSLCGVLPDLHCEPRPQPCRHCKQYRRHGARNWHGPLMGLHPP